MTKIVIIFITLQPYVILHKKVIEVLRSMTFFKLLFKIKITRNTYIMRQS